MPEFALLGAMNTKRSPFLEDGLVQHLCLNGEMRRPGYFEKRRGIATAVTAAAAFGTAPYRLFRWTNAKGTVLVACGADAVVFANPTNNYLYARVQYTISSISKAASAVVVTSTAHGLATGDEITFGDIVGSTGTDWDVLDGIAYTVTVSDTTTFTVPVNTSGYTGTFSSGVLSKATIYDDPTSFASKIDVGWGLDIMDVSSVNTDRATADSMHSGGAFAFAVAAYDEGRNVEGPISTVLNSGTAGVTSNLLQWCSGSTQTMTFDEQAAPDSHASHIRMYRNRILIFPKSSTRWEALRADKLQFYGLRQIREEAINTSGAGTNHVYATDTGGQPEGPVISFATTVVPFAKASIRFDGRWFYGADPTLPYRVIFTVPDCPETYAKKTTFGASGPDVLPVLAELGAEQVQPGEAIIDLPTDVGEFVGWASAGDQLMALCEYGAWRIIRVGQYAYGYARDPLSLGCVSRATIAESPYGVWWLAREGIVLWDGQTVPELVLRTSLDPSASDTPFHATQTGACAAYHVKRAQYIVCVPKVTSGQFLICVQADMPLRTGYVWQKWTHGLPTDIDGMGYDNTTGEIVYRLKTSGDCWSATDGTYQDGTASPTSFAFGLDAWYARGGGRGFVMVNPKFYLVVQRDSVTNQQTITFTARGAPTADESAGTSSGAQSLVLSATEYENAGALDGVSGEAIHASIRNTDAYHLALLSLTIFEEQQRRGA